MSSKPVAPNSNDPAEAPKGPGMVMWIVVAAVSGAAGFGAPMLLSGKSVEHPNEETPRKEVEKKVEKQVIIPFDSEGIVVNLNEVQPHYLRFKMSLQVEASQVKLVTDLLNEKKVLLKSWMLVHLGDKGMQDVRGGAGKNMLRREILERFNSMLFTDGYDRIYDVLFEEFTIQ